MPIAYRLVRALSRWLLRIFYRRIDVVGLEHVPTDGPLLVVANHQNGLVDPMLLLATIPRRLVPISKAPLFRHPIIAPFLRLAGAIPVHRRQDAADPTLGPERNVGMFSSAIAALRIGRALLIFPEGVSQPEPRLMPLRTGAARLALGAADENGRGVTVLPVGLVFEHPATFRTGRALVLVGTPFTVAPSSRENGCDGEDTVRDVTARIGETLRHCIVEARDRNTYRLLQLADAIWTAEDGSEPRDALGRTAWRQRVMRAHDHLAVVASGRLQALRRDLADYAQELEAADLAGCELVATYPAKAVLRYALHESVSILLGFPLALWGIAVHALPYGLTALVTRAVRPDADTEATFKIVAGLVLYPLCWAAEASALWLIGGPWRLAAFALVLLPAGAFALTWRDRLDRVRRDARAFLRFLGDGDLHRRLLVRRRALMDDMQALARLVPDDVLEAGARR